MRIRRLVIAFAAACAACGASHPAPRSTATPSNVATRPERAPTGPEREQAPHHPAVATALTPDVVLATIKDRYLSGVERCYARHAKLHGNATGHVLVSFTVDAEGKTRDGEAHGIARRVDGCISAQVARWQFPAPSAESRFALGLQLDTD